MAKSEQKTVSNYVLTIVDRSALNEIQGSLEILGFKVDTAFTHRQAKDALLSRPYEAIITSVSTDKASLFDEAIVDEKSQQMVYKSSFLRSLALDYPDTFRVIYGYEAVELEDIRHACFDCGADAVSNTPESIFDILYSIINYRRIELDAESKDVIYKELLNLAGGMVSHRLQKYNQIFEDRKTIKEVNHHVKVSDTPIRKCCSDRKEYSFYKSKIFRGMGSGPVVRIVQVSDTLGSHRSLILPEGDLFLHAGNFTSGKVASCLEQFHDFLTWINDEVLTKFRQVVFISGDQDMFLDIIACKYNAASREAQKILNKFLCNHPSVAFLENSSISFRGLKIFGSPTTLLNASYLSQNECKAFERNIESYARPSVDDECDILLTHRPPSFLYAEPNYELPSDHFYASQIDADDVKKPKIRLLFRKGKHPSNSEVKRTPRIHTFGHYGMEFGIEQNKGTVMVNCSQERVFQEHKDGGGIPLVVHLPTYR
jgi:hypothetical protein